MRRNSFIDTLDEIRARATSPRPEPKLAQAPTPGGDLLRKAASVLRDAAPPAVTFDDLYAVSNGTFEMPPEPSAPASYGEGPGAPMRKVAHLLREEHYVERVKVAALAADTIIAANGLTLLGDRLGSHS